MTNTNAASVDTASALCEDAHRYCNSRILQTLQLHKHDPQIAAMCRPLRLAEGLSEIGRMGEPSKPFSDPSGRTRKRLSEAETGRQPRCEGVAQVGGVKLPTRRRTADDRPSRGDLRLCSGTRRKPKHGGRRPTTMVRHRDYRKDRYAPFYLRKRIYERDAGQCQYCGVEVTMEECNIDHVIPRTYRGMTSKQNLVVACRGCNELKFGQLIPEGLRPRKGEAFLSRKEKRAGKKTEAQQVASERMKGTISIIQEASAMGIYLDDLFTEGTQKQWGQKP